MTKAITYSLGDYRKGLGDFYAGLSVFTDSVLDDLDSDVHGFVGDFCDFNEKSKIELFRSWDEYLVEFLMIGIYWNNYSGNASKTGILTKRLLNALYRKRKRFPKYKSEIDKVRGCLAYLFLEKHSRTLSAGFNKMEFIKLTNWLSATGEFNEEVLRLRNWVAFFKTKECSYIEKLIESAVLFGERFSLKGKEMLGKYVQNLDDFHLHSLPDYKYREDYFFAGRRENEYFLNMFAAEIMNRGLQKGFAQTTKKVLLLPTCMRTEPASRCKAISDGIELVCAACSGECNIGKVSHEMKKQGITSYLIPHSSDFSKFLVKWKDCPDTSLIGVACVLNLIAGGYEMKRLGISSQCVFLDYCGCKKHWDKAGIATSLNINHLKKVVRNTGAESEKPGLISV